jgi:hypothetical protein
LHNDEKIVKMRRNIQTALLKVNLRYTHRKQRARLSIQMEYPILRFYTSFIPGMRTAILLLLILPGCARPVGESAGPGKERTARLLAALVETAARNRRDGLDSARAEAAADSVLRSESVTREEFLSEVRSLNRDVTQWREVSEEAARILEQRLAARGAGR